jgi:hypothetical protein
MGLLPEASRSRRDVKVKDVLLLNTRTDTGNTILTFEMEGRPGDSSEKLFEAVNGKGFAVFILDQGLTEKLFKMLLGLVANRRIADEQRLVMPVEMPHVSER